MRCIEGTDNIVTPEPDGNNYWIMEGALPDEVLAYDGNPITFIEYADRIPEPGGL